MTRASRAACTVDFACLMAFRLRKKTLEHWLGQIDRIATRICHSVILLGVALTECLAKGTVRGRRCQYQPRECLVDRPGQQTGRVRQTAAASLADRGRRVQKSCIGRAEMKGRSPDLASATSSSVARTRARSALRTELMG